MGSDRFQTASAYRSISKHLASSKDFMDYSSIEKSHSGAMATVGATHVAASSKIAPIYSNNLLKPKSPNRSSFTRPNTGSGMRTMHARRGGDNSRFNGKSRRYITHAPDNIDSPFESDVFEDAPSMFMQSSVHLRSLQPASVTGKDPYSGR